MSSHSNFLITRNRLSIDLVREKKRESKKRKEKEEIMEEKGEEREKNI
jgi:hypothetical protein